MPLIYFSRSSHNLEEFYFVNSQPRDSLNGAKPSTSSSEFESRYQNLSFSLKSCLDYISFVTFKHSVHKDKLVHLLLAERLVPETPGKIMEESAEAILQDLISLGMLCQDFLQLERLEVNDNYKELCLVQVKENDFVAKSANSPVFALVYTEGSGIPPEFQGCQICSLFITNRSDQGLSRAYVESVFRLESLVVLDFEGIIECFPERVENMVFLRFLGVYGSGCSELPPSLFSLQNLQTLDIRGCRLGNRHEIPEKVLEAKNLRHLLVSHDSDNSEIRVPKGFGSLENLHTCDGLYGGNGIASELGNLIQLRKLVVKRVTDDHSDELVDAIAKMTNLISLSLEAEGLIFEKTLMPEMENFRPPKLLRDLSLYGGLVEIPSWIFSIENLTELYLSFSRLTENQISVLQVLPKLKHLTLWNVCNAKHLSKEFCDSGGFKELETLKIVSKNLVEWSEVVNGSFPSLRFLTFRNCMMLKFLPKGLQNILTLRYLCILPAYTDIGRRLYGEENYKIKHIEDVRIYELPSSFSM